MSSSRPASQRLVIEAMTAASEFISEEMRKDFLIIGGAALVRYGSERITRDVDIAISAQTLDAFWERASSDPRFSLQPDGHWIYTAQGPDIEGLLVEFEFLTLDRRMRGMTRFDPIWVASLADIAAMKAHAFQNRSEPRDYSDLLYTLQEMKKRKETLMDYRIKKSDVETIQAVVGGDKERERCLSEVMG